MIRASVDLMGGDWAPEVILKAAANFHDVHFVFVGDASVKEKIAEYGISNYSFVESGYVLQEGKKVSKQDLERSSLYFAINQVKEKRADFVISGGSSGYYLLLCRQLLGTIGSISRPAITATIPTQKGVAIMLDLGANITCSDDDLVKFAIMGASLAQFWLNVQVPKVGFINVGSESGKGPEFVRSAAAKFQAIHPEFYGGFAEGNDTMNGDFDVLVVDGFAGNCMLKFGEGLSVLFKTMFKNAFKNGILNKIALFLLGNRLKRVFIDPRRYNGAIFAGINGCAIKSHGGSDEVGFRYALEFGIKIAKNNDNLLEKMSADFEKLGKISHLEQN